MPASPIFVPRDRDRHDEPHDVGIGRLSFKVTAAESQGDLVVAELAHHAPGGPPLHVHPQQDEWFYVTAGRYVIVAGELRFDLGPGDAVFGPRGVPHTWAYVGGEPGRIVFAVAPAARIEEFLRALSRSTAMAPQDAEFWRRYGLEVAGPPIPLP